MKELKTLIITMLLLITSSATYSAVGISSLSAGITLKGVGYTLGGLLTTSAGLSKDDVFNDAIVLGGRWTLLFVGVILLDEEQKTIQFKEITEAKRIELGIRKSDMDIYNSELAEVNIVFNEVALEVSKNPTRNKALKEWESYKDMLSAETINVMQVIVENK